MPKGHYTHQPHALKLRPVIIPIGPSIAYIELTRGAWAVVSILDLPIVGRLPWHLSDMGYARTGRIYMHRLLKDAPYGSEVDHVNECKLHNLPHNIRVCSSSQNKCNKGKKRTNTSGFKGVSWDKSKGVWRAYIGYQRKSYALGYFQTPEEAYLAYCAAASRFHGEFARMV